MYEFATQLRQGVRSETLLDAYFQRWFEITPATPAQQRQGIDRLYRERRTGRRLSVEYKADETASRTGNAFIETVSVDVRKKLGWIVTSRAEYLFYYLPVDDLLYVCRFAVLRQQLARWKRRYPVRRIPNNGYHTHGLLVPLHEFERYSEAQLSVH